MFFYQSSVGVACATGRVSAGRQLLMMVGVGEHQTL